MRIHRSFALLAASIAGLLAHGCADYGSDTSHDSGLPQDGSSQPADQSDGSSQQADQEFIFCSNAAKLELDGHLYSPVQVTSDRLVMDCCDGAILRFHLAGETGFDIIVWLRFFSNLSPGEYQLPEEEYMLDVAYSHTTAEPFESQPLSGSLRVVGQDTPEDPLLLTLCGEADWLRLWVEDFPVLAYQSWEHFAIHRLVDPDIGAAEAASRPLESLELFFEPLVELGTLSYYDAQTHTMVLGMWLTAEYIRNQLPDLTVGGRPFVVTVHGQPIYLGAFFTSLSSESFNHPVIIIDPPIDPENHLVIDRAYPGGGPTDLPDPRPDPRLFDLLRKAGKLKE